MKTDFERSNKVEKHYKTGKLICQSYGFEINLVRHHSLFGFFSEHLLKTGKDSTGNFLNYVIKTRLSRPQRGSFISDIGGAAKAVA